MEKWKKRDGEKRREEKESRQNYMELKLDGIHSDGSALNIRRLVEELEGVERVTVDAANKKLTVIGKINRWELKESLEARTNNKVEVIFPKEPPKEEKKEEKKKDNDVNDPTKSSNDVKEGGGVQEATVDAAKDLVTVKDTMDAKTFPAVLKPGVEVVPRKKHAGRGGGGDEKKDKGVDGGGGEKKEKEGGGGAEKKEAVATATTKTVAEANKMGYFGRFLRRVWLPFRDCARPADL